MVGYKITSDGQEVDTTFSSCIRPSWVVSRSGFIVEAQKVSSYKNNSRLIEGDKPETVTEYSNYLIMRGRNVNLETSGNEGRSL